MKQAPSRMHDFRTQFAPHHSSAYVSPFGFNVSNTKLDVLSGAPSSYSRTRPPAFATLTRLATHSCAAAHTCTRTNAFAQG